VALRADLAYERYNIARPRQTYRLLQEADGLGTPTAYGPPTPNVADPAFPLMDETELDSSPSLEDPPKIASFPVADPEPILGLQSGKQPVLVAGDAEGLVNMAGSGLITGHELLMFAASFADDPDQMRELLGSEGELVLTDTNRKAGRRWGTVHETNGYTEEADEEALAFDSTDNRLPVFPDADTDSFTVAEHRGVHARATTYGNPVSFIPESRPAMAVDDDPTTAWLVGAFASIKGEAIELQWDTPRTTDSIRLAQPTGGFQNRFITKVSLRLDDGPEQVIDLSDLSEIEAGQIVRFPKQSFSKARITLLESDDGQDVTFTGLSAVGFADIRLGDDDAFLDEVLRLPTDMLDAVGEESLDHPLSVLLTRRRIRPTVALRDDPESSIVRTFDLPTDRTFSLEGQIRFSDDAPESVLDRLLGIPTVAEGGVDSYSSRQLPGAITARASSAIDGDPKTHWSPGFLRQRGELLHYKTAQPVSFDEMDLTIVNDLRHSIPTQIRIWARGQEPVLVDVPPIKDQLGRDRTSTVHLEFPEVTGDDITFTIAQARSVTTNDWYSKLAVATPVGISELGVPGLSVPTPTGRVDDRCRDDLVRVNGTSIPIRLEGTVKDALAGRPLHFEACDEAGVDIPAGEVEVRSALGEEVGLDVDQLELRSAAGGEIEPEPSAPLTADGPDSGDEGRDGDPSLRITGKTRISFDADVTRTDDDTWLVLGQSQSLGWHLTVDGEDLGPPVLVNGYANGWKLPKSDGPLEVQLRWTPQRVVNGGLIASVFGLLLCLVLAFWPRRRLTMADHGDLDPPPSPLTPRLSASYLGDRPGVGTTVVAAVATLLVASALVSVPAGVLLALGMVIALRRRSSRLVIGLTPGLMLGLSGIYTILVQVRRGTRAGYEWPISLEEIHQVGWGAVGLLVIGVVADRLWAGRWWGDPSDPVDAAAAVAPAVDHDPSPEPSADDDGEVGRDPDLGVGHDAAGDGARHEVNAGLDAPAVSDNGHGGDAPHRDGSPTDDDDDDDVASPVP
jgi:arabinofuranan 3-O-arabinosyltransferase